MAVALPRQAEAWTDFWHEQSQDSHCLAGATPDVRHALQGHWASFASAISPKSHVLDLGCGAGAAGQAMVAARPRLSRSSEPRLRAIW